MLNRVLLEEKIHVATYISEEKNDHLGERELKEKKRDHKTYSRAPTFPAVLTAQEPVFTHRVVLAHYS